jgi:DNA-binding MarR family transcriptional regulator
MSDLYGKPGYQIRRLRQIASSIFANEAGDFSITSQQWTVLNALSERSPLEQIELSSLINLDGATLAVLLSRLEERGLVRRTPSERDKRRKYVALTAGGKRVLAAMAPAVARVQERILTPLAPADRAAFVRILNELVEAHDANRALDLSNSEAS